MHRLIDAHLAVAERERNRRPERGARILDGLWALMDAEAARQGWRLNADQTARGAADDIELNARD